MPTWVFEQCRHAPSMEYKVAGARHPVACFLPAGTRELTGSLFELAAVWHKYVPSKGRAVQNKGLAGNTRKET